MRARDLSVRRHADCCSTPKQAGSRWLREDEVEERVNDYLHVHSFPFAPSLEQRPWSICRRVREYHFGECGCAAGTGEYGPGKTIVSFWSAPLFVFMNCLPRHRSLN